MQHIYDGEASSSDGIRLRAHWAGWGRESRTHLTKDTDQTQQANKTKKHNNKAVQSVPQNSTHGNVRAVRGNHRFGEQRAGEQQQHACVWHELSHQQGGGEGSRTDKEMM